MWYVMLASRKLKADDWNVFQFELLLCIEDAKDPVIGVVKRLQSRYPDVDCRLFIGGKAGILNPMVFNMSPGYENAKYDVVWISTSRIKGWWVRNLFDMILKSSIS